MNEAAQSSWIVELISNSTYLGVAALMFMETVFPPIPSEVVMPVAGFLAAEGRLSLAGAIAAGTAGSLAGAYAWFAVARRIGAERLKRWATRRGRWLTIAPDDIDAVCRWFTRHGPVAVMAGRLVPAVRSLISIPAGIAGMESRTFLTWSALGAALWTGLLAAIGYFLGNRYEGVARYIGLFSNVVIAGAVVLYAYRVVTFRRS